MKDNIELNIHASTKKNLMWFSLKMVGAMDDAYGHNF